MTSPDSAAPQAASRRRFVGQLIAGAGMLAIGGQVLAGINPATRALRNAASGAGRKRFLDALGGGLLPPDANGVRLPAGFTSRIVARSGEAPVAGVAHTWHPAPDGGATYATPDGGWVYACNSEMGSQAGGVGALRFDADGNPVDAYSILSGTSVNCAGGQTPWNTWLSCEEFDQGLVWECDPFQPGQGIARPALGTFSHEAACVDAANEYIYLTEDKGDSCFYRMKPDSYPDLSSGRLEVAVAGPRTATGEQTVAWVEVPNPNPAEGETPTRNQVAGALRFARGEGMYFHGGVVYFTTTADNRVWAYRTSDATLRIFYDAAASAAAPLHDPDNVIVDASGFVYVAEDSDDLQIVLIDPAGNPSPFLQLVGHDNSEVAGPAFSPDGTRLYFSSQRGTAGDSASGITFEIVGPFPGIDRIFDDGFDANA